MGVWKSMSGMALRSCAVTTLDLRGRPGQRDREGRMCCAVAASEPLDRRVNRGIGAANGTGALGHAAMGIGTGCASASGRILPSVLWSGLAIAVLFPRGSSVNTMLRRVIADTTFQLRVLPPCQYDE